VEEVERLAPVWDELPWKREEAERDYLLARIHSRPDAIAPFGVVVTRDGVPVAGLAGRVESRRLQTSIGYRVVYAPEVRMVQVVDGGLVATDAEAIPPLFAALRSALGEADAVALPPLELGSELLAAADALGGPLERQRLIAPWTRRRLALPGSFEEFLATRSRNVRSGIRYDTRKLRRRARGRALRRDPARARRPRPLRRGPRPGRPLELPAGGRGRLRRHARAEGPRRNRARARLGPRVRASIAAASRSHTGSARPTAGGSSCGRQASSASTHPTGWGSTC